MIEFLLEFTIKITILFLTEQTKESSVKTCPPTWDGWQCWPDGGNPGRIEFRPCPSYIHFHSESKGNEEFTDTCGSKLIRRGDNPNTTQNPTFKTFISWVYLER